MLNALAARNKKKAEKSNQSRCESCGGTEFSKDDEGAVACDSCGWVASREDRVIDDEDNDDPRGFRDQNIYRNVNVRKMTAEELLAQKLGKKRVKSSILKYKFELPNQITGEATEQDAEEEKAAEESSHSSAGASSSEGSEEDTAGSDLEKRSETKRKKKEKKRKKKEKRKASERKRKAELEKIEEEKRAQKIRKKLQVETKKLLVSDGKLDHLVIERVKVPVEFTNYEGKAPFQLPARVKPSGETLLKVLGYMFTALCVAFTKEFNLPRDHFMDITTKLYRKYLDMVGRKFYISSRFRPIIGKTIGVAFIRPTDRTHLGLCLLAGHICGYPILQCEVLNAVETGRLPIYQRASHRLETSLIHRVTEYREHHVEATRLQKQDLEKVGLALRTELGISAVSMNSKLALPLLRYVRIMGVVPEDEISGIAIVLLMEFTKHFDAYLPTFREAKNKIRKKAKSFYTYEGPAPTSVALGILCLSCSMLPPKVYFAHRRKSLGPRCVFTGEPFKAIPDRFAARHLADPGHPERLQSYISHHNQMFNTASPYIAVEGEYREDNREEVRRANKIDSHFSKQLRRFCEHVPDMKPPNEPESQKTKPITFPSDEQLEQGRKTFNEHRLRLHQMWGLSHGDDTKEAFPCPNFWTYEEFVGLPQRSESSLFLHYIINDCAHAFGYTSKRQIVFLLSVTETLTRFWTSTLPQTYNFKANATFRQLSKVMRHQVTQANRGNFQSERTPSD